MPQAADRNTRRTSQDVPESTAAIKMVVPTGRFVSWRQRWVSANQRPSHSVASTAAAASAGALHDEQRSGFEAKAADIIGLHLEPPQHAAVFCVDEKSAIQALDPYHRFAGTLFRSAADPLSPLSPFGAESAAERQKAVALFAEVVNGSTGRIPEDLRTELPDLLWLYCMGVVLFWIHDRSPGHRRTDLLIDHTTELIARLIGFASIPIFRPLRQATLRMLNELRTDQV